MSYCPKRLVIQYLTCSTFHPMTTIQPRAVVVGSGLAGLSAATQLLSHSIPVTLLDRAPKPGGNSIKASSGINGAPTKYQPVPDDLFLADTVKSAGNVFTVSRTAQREKLVETLTGNSAAAIEWLTEAEGIDLSKVAQLGGHSRARTHRGAGKLPPGAAIVTTLLKKLQADERFTLLTSSTVTRILRNDGVVTGVKYTSDGEEKEIQSPAVIFATGGFAGDASGMLATYRPDLAGFPSTNEALPGSHKLLVDAGAQLLDMEHVQVHPTGFVDPSNPEAPVKFLAAEVLRGEGGIMLDTHGKRFVNELLTRDKVTDAIYSTEKLPTERKQWDVKIVLDEGAYEAAKSHVDFYVFKGLLKKTSVGELSDGARKTIENYGKIVAGEEMDVLGRTVFGHWSSRPSEITAETTLYVGSITPVVHFTMGGVIIDEKARVLDKEGNPIRGVWAAGEVSGGVHGENRLGGSSLLECAVFGRIAGDGAAALIKEATGEI